MAVNTAVSLSRKEIEHIARLEDGASPDNRKDVLDKGDVLHVKIFPNSDRFDFVEAAHAVDAFDVSSYSSLKKFLETATGDKVDFVSGGQGEHLYLVYRPDPVFSFSSKLGKIKVLDLFGSGEDLAALPFDAGLMKTVMALKSQTPNQYEIYDRAKRSAAAFASDDHLTVTDVEKYLVAVESLLRESAAVLQDSLKSFKRQSQPQDMIFPTF